MAVESFTGRRCFITGAASGIGRATAIAVARRGAVVYLTDIDGEGLERTAAEIAATGAHVGFARPLDLRDHEAVVAAAAEIHAADGSMDVVMNIAGVSTWGTTDRLGHSDWREM